MKPEPTNIRVPSKGVPDTDEDWEDYFEEAGVPELGDIWFKATSREYAGIALVNNQYWHVWFGRRKRKHSKPQCDQKLIAICMRKDDNRLRYVFMREDYSAALLVPRKNLKSRE